MEITTIGIDLAKNVFQVHGVNKHGKVLLRKQLRREHEPSRVWWRLQLLREMVWTPPSRIARRWPSTWARS
ncbi:hypothetical protein PT2222_410011 [Paraburkholderia tropica]